MKCAHCNVDYEKESLIKDGAHFFCCVGCAGVFKLLHSKGLGEFYEKRQDATLEPKNAQNALNFINALNAQDISQDFLSTKNPLNSQNNLNTQSPKNSQNSVNLNAILSPNSSENFGEIPLENSSKNLQDFPDFTPFLQKTKDGFSKVNLIISGIHCAACVWLIEKVLINQSGVMQVSLNALSHKASVVFDESEVSLAAILQLILSVGYTPKPYNPHLASKAVATKREFYSRLIVAIACVMNIMWLAVAKYAGLFSGMSAEIKDILNFAEFVLATPVLFFTGSAFYKNAYFSLKNRQISMDFLVIFGASLAYTYSVWAMFARVGEVYFDSVAMIICFVFVGKYLESVVKRQVVDTMDSLNAFLQGQVLVFDGKKFTKKDIFAVKKGDLIELKTGDKVLIDGLCVSGEASFDASSLSGEDEPVLVNAGKKVLSACIVLDGALKYKATHTYYESKLGRIIALLENATAKKPKIQALAEQIAQYFSRTMLFIALACFCFWYFLHQSGAEIALINAISVLIIACPCALALATPVSNLIALFRALRLKVLFKSSAKIEELSKCDTAVFDKTGVLTDNAFKISKSFIKNKADLNELLAFVRLSKHPVSLCVAEFLIAKGAKNKDFEFDGVNEIRAKGIKGYFRNAEFIGGNVDFIKEKGIKCEEKFTDTHFVLAKDGEIMAFFEFESELRLGAAELINYFKSLNIRLIMLTGDNKKAASKIAKKLGISDFKAGCSPEKKMQIVQGLKGRVLMVGDGINDALALQSASVAVSLKQGSDTAVENSDVVLLKSDLGSLKSAFVLAKKTYKIIKQNLAFSLAYNAFTIPLAFLGLINPLIAAVSMSFSSIVVLLNATRIRL